jgi:Protein of unknown function (DUF1036)
MVTLAGLEPATPLAPARNKGALSPLSYSAVMILRAICGGARAGHPRLKSGDFADPRQIIATTTVTPGPTLTRVTDFRAMSLTAPSIEIEFASRMRRPLVADKFRRVLLASLFAALPCTIFSTGPAAADFQLCNNTSSRVGIAVGYKDADGWTTEGWWNLPARAWRDRAEGQPGRPLILCLRHRLRSRRRMDGTGRYVHS